MTSFVRLGRRTLPFILALVLVPFGGAHGQDLPAADPSAGQVASAPADPLLEESTQGKEAVDKLGEQVRVAAARNELSTKQFRTLLRSDDAAWVDPDGRIFYVDPMKPASAHTTEGTAVAPIAPLDKTFALHSNPGANRSIFLDFDGHQVFLDFDGHQVENTAWNHGYGMAAATHPAWDPSGDGPAFNDYERAQVQQVWAMVAEDFAPFDVDVTTEDPGYDALERSTTEDSVYGSRVLITPSDIAWSTMCGRGCGGIAYLSVFDTWNSSFYQPAWVFTGGLGDDTKNIAEAASHEAGHNLGLGHDGTTAAGYYRGHGLWAPIMGVGYDRPLAQWSAGSYPDANNGQDDASILRGYLGSRSDEASGSPATPSPLPDGAALIGSRTDVDSYLLGSCEIGSSVEISPAPVAPNLVIRAELFDGDGNLSAVSSPSPAWGDRTTAVGLGAAFTVPATSDDWVVTVDGVGHNWWTTSGFDDYGSLGAYTISAPGCDGSPRAGAPGIPAEVGAEADGVSAATLSWDQPADGGGQITSYVVTRSGSTTSVVLPASARTHSFTDLAAETTYQLSVRAVNGVGAGHSVTRDVTTSTPPPTPPGAPRDMWGRYDHSVPRLEAFWAAPESSGSHPVIGYDIYLDGAFVVRGGADWQGVYLTHPDGFTEGDHVIGVAAVSEAGNSTISTLVVPVEHPRPPVNDDIGSAVGLVGPSGSVLGDNAVATSEPTDPPAPGWHGAGGYSVWYRWTATEFGTMTMRTTGGEMNRDTTLAAYTGEPGTLTEIAGNDDHNGLHAEISFDAAPGTQYLVAVDGYASTNGHGPFTLEWSQEPAGPPSAPWGVRGNPNDRSMSVHWSAPTANGAPITRYEVTARAASGDEHTASVAGTTTSATLTDLTNETPYNVTVTATNAAGTSAASEAIEVVPEVLDAVKPMIGAIESSGRKLNHPYFGDDSTTIRVRLSDDRRVVDFPTVTLRPVSGEQWFDWDTLTYQSEFATWLSLTRGTRREGEWTADVTLPSGAPVGPWAAGVTAADGWGNTAVLTPGSVPLFEVVSDPLLGSRANAPEAVTSTAGSSRARVRWSPPAGPVTDYTVYAHPGLATVDVAGHQTSALIGGLDNGTEYTFSVVAGNDVGESAPASSTEPVTPSLSPSPPRGVAATAGDRRATVTWEPTFLPDDVDSYTVTAAPSGRSVTVDSEVTTATLTGLDMGTGYRFSVTATNAEGESPPSLPSNEVTPVGAPDAPTRPTVAPGDKQAVVTWTAPADNGSAITGYTVAAYKDGTEVSTATVGSVRRSTTVKELINGTAYTFTVTATNAVGDSTPSAASEPVTPSGVPDAPAKPTAASGDKSAQITWTKPANGGSPITGYTVTSTPGGHTKTVTGANTTTTTITGLTNDTAYTFTVTATNAVGSSPASAPSNGVTPRAADISPPELSDFDFTPKSIDVNDGARQVAVTVRITDTTGVRPPTLAINSDATTMSAGLGEMTRISGTATDGIYERLVTIPQGADAGAWTVRLHPLEDTLGNSDGTFHNHPTKLTVTDTPHVTEPEAPAKPTATHGDGTAQITWTKPADGGSTITGYTVTSTPGGHTKTVTGATTTTITGLTNGTAYTFTVTATNVVGHSPASLASSPVVPRPNAKAPSKVKPPKVVLRGRKAIVRWSAARSNGSPVTRYMVDISRGRDRSLPPRARTTAFKLKPGVYRVRVAARNTVGRSPYSRWIRFRIR